MLMKVKGWLENSYLHYVLLAANRIVKDLVFGLPSLIHNRTNIYLYAPLILLAYATSFMEDKSVCLLTLSFIPITMAIMGSIDQWVNGKSQGLLAAYTAMLLSIAIVVTAVQYGLYDRTPFGIMSLFYGAAIIGPLNHAVYYFVKTPTHQKSE